MPIDTIKVGSRFRRDLGNLKDLVESIRVRGLLHPVVVTPDGELIAGQRRLEACKRLGWVEIPVTVLPIDDIARGQWDENAVRKPLLPSEKVAAARIFRPEEEQAARRRQAQAGPTAGQGAENGSGNLPERVRGDTRDRVARCLGMSGKTLEKAEAVVSAAEQDPNKFGLRYDDLPIADGETATLELERPLLNGDTLESVAKDRLRSDLFRYCRHVGLGQASEAPSQAGWGTRLSGGQSWVKVGRGYEQMARASPPYNRMEHGGRTTDGVSQPRR